jgi:hypothetical protein
MSKASDLYNAAYGNFGQKVLGTVGAIGTMARAPELGISELFGTARASAAEPIPTGGDYSIRAKLNADGQTIGFDYFLNGQPITEQEYAAAGLNLEGDQQLAIQDLQTYTQETIPDPTLPGGGGDTFATHYVNGVAYNDIATYTNALTQAATDQFNQQNKLLTNAYQSGLLDFATYQDQLKQARDTIKDQYGQAMGSIGGRFSALSPDAYQSSQGTAENRAKDITDQNYSNVNLQEANLGQQRTLYDQDYANNLAANQSTMQNQIDSNLNEVSATIDGTPYANKMNEINKPVLNTMTPMDSSVLGSYDAIAQQFKEGNMPAVKSSIDALDADQTIKDWLYTRFQPTQ